MAKKKILAILQLPPPGHGAAFVGQQIKNNKAINKQFDISYLRISTKAISKHLQFKGLQPFFYAVLLMRIFKRLLFNKYDLVYITPCASGLQFYKDFIICLITKILNPNVVYHFHNKGIRKNKYINNFVKKIFFKNVNVILLSDYLKSDLEDYVKSDNLHYCANGVNIRSLTPESNLSRHHYYGPVLLFLSNMIRTKGVFVLLEACYLLKQKKPNFICQFVGPWYENLENEFFQKVNDYKLSNHVQYLGPKYGSEKDQAFKNAHIFVFPTYSECFPLVTLEAMSYGLPVVSTTEGAIPEIIRNGIDGFTVEKNNPTKLANCLEKLLENEEIYKNMSASARERYQQNYTEAHFAKHFINIINHITKNK